MRRLALAALAAGSAGCATLVQGSRQYLTVASRPAGATARAESAPELSCETPCSLLLPRSRATTVAVEAPGYRTARVPVARSIDPLVLGNVILPPFSIFWAAVDLASGAGFRLDPVFVSVALEPEPRIAGGQLPSASCGSGVE